MNSRFGLIFLLSAFTVMCYNASAQTSGNPTVYPYGGERDFSRKQVRIPALHFRSNNFVLAHFAGSAYFKVAQFDSSAEFNGAQFNSNADFGGAHFASIAYFSDARFASIAYFGSARFDSSAYFSGTYFANSADFVGAQFNSSAYFSDAHFAGSAIFSAQFASRADFFHAHFDSGASFSSAQFASSANFVGAQFAGGASFHSVSFKEPPVFDAAVLKGTIDLSESHFLEGIDLRRASLDSVTTIYINDHFSFPDGKLLVRWDQIKERVHLDPWDADYRRVEIFYYRLRDNFLAQRDNSSADAVMYELGSQRATMLGEWHWRFYGWLFGWGYQPWRFLLFVVLPLIILFAVVWYWFYYELVIRIVDDKIDQKYAPRTDKLLFSEKTIHLFGPGRTLFPSIGLRVYDHSKSALGVGRLLRYWHVLFFSASVLLGIRFKKEWIQIFPPTNRVGRRSFLHLATFEWLLGISLYVVFALLVKGSRFEFIKGLLGF